MCGQNGRLPRAGWAKPSLARVADGGTGAAGVVKTRVRAELRWTKSESVRNRVDKKRVRAEVWSKRAVSAEKSGQNSSPCGARDHGGAYASDVSPAREAGDPERVNISSARTPVLSKGSTRTPILSTFLRTKASFVQLSPHGLEFCPPTAALAPHEGEFCPHFSARIRFLSTLPRNRCPFCPSAIERTLRQIVFHPGAMSVSPPFSSSISRGLSFCIASRCPSPICLQAICAAPPDDSCIRSLPPRKRLASLLIASMMRYGGRPEAPGGQRFLHARPSNPQASRVHR